MLTHAQLMTPDLDDPDDTPDIAVGIGQQVIRCRFRGARAVALSGESSPKTQIAALLDLLDLHLSTPATRHGVPVATDRVAVLSGREGTFLSYPFTVTELRELADELAVEPVEDTDLAVG